VTNNPDLFNLADTVVWLEQGRVKNMGMPEKVGPDFYGGS
jgi:ABC-type molybdate transport system ATPase subunit